MCVRACVRACVRGCVCGWMDGVSVTADMPRLRLSERPTEAGDGLPVRTSNQKLKLDVAISAVTGNVTLNSGNKTEMTL